MAKRRTRKQKVASQGRVRKSVARKAVGGGKEMVSFKADLTKSLWLTMLAVGVEVALWYLWKPGY